MIDKPKKENLFLILTSFFTVLVILSNLLAVKLVKVPFFEEIALPAGLLIFPITFLIADLVTEIFGSNKARMMVYLAFGLSLFASAILHLSVMIPPHPAWVSPLNPFGFESSVEYQHAYRSVFGLTGITVLSSMAAYVLSQILDIHLFQFFKQLTGERHLWFRNIASTLTSQIIDTLVVNILLLYCGLKLELNTVIKICLLCYLYKAVFTVANIPLFYTAVWASKRYLGEGPKESVFLRKLRWKTSYT